MLPEFTHTSCLILTLVIFTCMTMAKLRRPILYNLHSDRTVCRTIPGLSKDQMELCYKEPDTTMAAMKGLQYAVSECQHQFKEQRWNCSSLVTKEKYPYTSPLFRKGFRETSFAQAISSAGISIAVARECSLGALLNCGCDSRKYQNQMRETLNWKWSGCSHNIHYSTRFAKLFLDRREKAKDIHANVNHHNNRIGRMVVKNNMQIKCKCHGMSGSCEFKTCWRIVPDMRIIGNILKEKYRNAHLFTMSNRGFKKIREKYDNRLSSQRKRRRSKEKKSTHRQNLIYYQTSPSYCEADISADVAGTSGRFCNRTSNGPDNCSSLCCGRGYNLLRRIRTELCKCKFEWCCEVKCDTCTIDEWISVCK
ncbi:hypothetical protein WA026_000832 [Henosepilachna vigintioctopunctata]|uniref:Protein Wnt n=1 Tax=Henosepilachna vigintioctopunctata TaxID=420089 RepID=A0AAW1UYW8_9CUCU